MTCLYEYQVKILKQDMGKMFLPMFFYNEEINGKTETNIKYDFSDCISLEEWLKVKENSLLDVLDVLENIALLLDKCKEVLINYEYLRIGVDNVYVSTKHHMEIKLQYMPKDEMDNKFSFYQLVSEIEQKTEDNLIKEYLQMIGKRLEKDKPGLTRIINIIGQIKREVYICGWIGKGRAI